MNELKYEIILNENCIKAEDGSRVKIITNCEVELRDGDLIFTKIGETRAAYILAYSTWFSVVKI